MFRFIRIVRHRKIQKSYSGSTNMNYNMYKKEKEVTHFMYSLIRNFKEESVLTVEGYMSHCFDLYY